MKAVTTTHSKEEVLAFLKGQEVAAIATAAGDKVRTRMMHYAIDDDFSIYLASMKGDPKTVQVTHHPSLSLLIYRPEANVNDSQEVEVTGTAALAGEPKEREKALELIAEKSPVVKYLKDSGNAGVLDCIKVKPETIKYRVFKEIVQGVPPTVLDFPANRQAVSDGHLLKLKAKSWLTELRAPFLTASVVPVLLGTAIGWLHGGAMHWAYFLLALVAGVCLHLGTNIINDYFDHKSGNDEVNREFVRPFSGGSRTIQLGLLTPIEVLLLAIFFFAVGSIIGFYLAWARGPFILVLGAIALVSGVFYTGRPLNFASRGVGEFMVGLNFGVLMTLGAYYVQTQTLSWVPVIAALPVSLLIAGVLYINEFPDYVADRAVGKRTLVVRLGKKGAVPLYAFIMVGTYIAIIGGVAAGTLPAVTLLALATLPLSLRAVIYARKYHSSTFDIVPANALTIFSHMATGLFLAVAFAWEGWGIEPRAYVAPVALAAVALVAYFYWQVEKQKRIAQGLKQKVQ